MSCGVGRRRGSDPALLWLWHRPVGTVPIGPLAWEPPYAAGAAQEIAKSEKNIYWSSHCVAAETNMTRNHEVVGWIPGLPQWVKDLVSL